MKHLIVILLIIYLSGCNNLTPNESKYNQTMIANSNIDSILIDELNFSECKHNCDIRSRIINQSLINNICRLKIGAHLNCAGNFTSSASLISDTLNLRIKLTPEKDGSISGANCNCFFEIDIVIYGIIKLPTEILVNNQTLDENLKTESDVIIIENEDSFYKNTKFYNQ